MNLVACESKTIVSCEVRDLWSHPCPGNSVAIGRAVVPGGGGGDSGTEGGRTRVTNFAEEGVFFKGQSCIMPRLPKH